MGGASSKNEGAGTEAKPRLLPAGQWPYLHRHALVHVIGAYVMEDQVTEAENKLKELRKLCGMSESLAMIDSTTIPDEAQSSDSEPDFHPNARTEGFIQHLTNLLLTSQSNELKENFMITITKLSIEISPPYYQCRGIPNMGEETAELMMTGKDLYTNSLELNKLNKYIASSVAKYVVKFDLGYTGIDDSNLAWLLPRLSRLPRLSYLGLQGNRLTMASVQRIQLQMGEKDHFYSLKWIDWSNNLNVFAVPRTFVTELERRWEQETYRPSLEDLVPGTPTILLIYGTLNSPPLWARLWAGTQNENIVFVLAISSILDVIKAG